MYNHNNAYNIFSLGLNTKSHLKVAVLKKKKQTKRVGLITIQSCVGTFFIVYSFFVFSQKPSGPSFWCKNIDLFI